MKKIRKVKGTKICVIKQKLKFVDHKHCFKATEVENKINLLEKNKLDMDSLRKNNRIHKKLN